MPGMSAVQAQVVAEPVVDEQAVIAELKAQLNDLMIQFLMAQIADLQRQIEAILSEQAQKQFMPATGTILTDTAPALDTEAISCKGGVVIMPIYVEGLWDNIFLRAYSEETLTDLRKWIDNKRRDPRSSKAGSFDGDWEIGQLKTGTKFSYTVEVYAEATKVNGRKERVLVSQKSGEFVSPDCEKQI